MSLAKIIRDWEKGDLNELPGEEESGFVHLSERRKN